MIRSIQKNYGFIVLLLGIVIFRSSIADWNTIPSGSMIPNLLVGDRVFVQKLAYDLRLPLTNYSLWHRKDPERGDIVVFDSKPAGKKLIKRVVGIPGDIISLQNNHLTINDTAAQYPHVPVQAEGNPDFQDTADLLLEILPDRETVILVDPQGAPPYYGNFKPIKVPAGHLLVMGDNRQHSADSRVYGFIPFNELRGKATHVIFSLDKNHHYLPRSNRLIHKLN
ncbi:MAG: signal peptidase I [Thiotrichales bacterium]